MNTAFAYVSEKLRSQSLINLYVTHLLFKIFSTYNSI